MSVYGGEHEESNIPITISPKTSDAYGAGKLRDEKKLSSICDNLDILRLMPVYDSEHMEDVRKRIFFPKTNIKFRILPSPVYCLCNVNVVCDAVIKCLGRTSGRRLHQVGNKAPISQRELLEKFPGFALIIPQVVFKICIKLLPERLKIGCQARLLLKKLALPKVFEVGVRELP